MTATLLKAVAASPQRGKLHAAKRRTKPVVYLLLLGIAVAYLVYDRVKARSLDAGLAALDEEAAALQLEDAEQAEQSALGVRARACRAPPLVSSWALPAERAAWRRTPRYSTHTCITQKFYDNYHIATCKFDNVCVNASTRAVEYYVDPAYSGVPEWGVGNPVAFDHSGEPQEDFPPTMVNPGHARIDTNVSWAPTVVRRPFPRPGARVKWAPADQALLAAMPPPLLWNFGHVMFDVMVPIFNMQHQFGLYDPAAQVLIPFAVNGSDDELRHWLPRLINSKRPEHSVLRLTHDRGAAWLGEYARRVLGGADDGLVCFRTLLAGTGGLSRQMGSVDALPYRQAVVRHLGIHEPPHRRPVLTILNKQGRRAVENWREVARLLRGRYPRAAVDVRDFAKRPDLGMREQVQLMSDTSILLTPCGGLATVLTFLRPQSTAIVLNYWNTHLNRSLQMEDNYYSHMEYLDFQYMPVAPEDYEGTSDRPECELVEGGGRPEDAHAALLGSLVHCNVRLAGAGLQRLLTLVDNAMQRWAARTGRYDVLAGPGRRGAQAGHGGG